MPNGKYHRNRRRKNRTVKLGDATKKVKSRRSKGEKPRRRRRRRNKLLGLKNLLFILAYGDQKMVDWSEIQKRAKKYYNAL